MTTSELATLFIFLTAVFSAVSFWCGIWVGKAIMGQLARKALIAFCYYAHINPRYVQSFIEAHSKREEQ